MAKPTAPPEATGIIFMLPLNRIAGIRRFIKQEGTTAALLKAAAGLVAMVYRLESAYILARPATPATGPSACPEGVKVDLLRGDQIDQLATITYYGRDEIVRRLNAGQKCIIAEYKGGIVHYSWLTPKNEYADELEKVILLEAGERYLYNCRTMASARGKGIFPAAIARALDEANSSGASHMITLVDTNNESSLRAFAKMAFLVREEITMTRWLTFRRYRHKKH